MINMSTQFGGSPADSLISHNDLFVFLCSAYMHGLYKCQWMLGYHGAIYTKYTQAVQIMWIMQNLASVELQKLTQVCTQTFHSDWG